MKIEISHVSAPTKLADLLLMQHATFAMPCGGKGTCKKCKVTASGDLSPMTDAERACLTEQEIQTGVRMACMAMATGPCTIHYTSSDDHLQGLLSGRMPKFDPHPRQSVGIGFAADIGTTTVAAYAYDLETLQCIAARSEANAQSPFGADVISRIEHAAANGCAPLQNAIRSQLSRLMQELCGNQAPVCATLTGNTTMLHLFAGLDPTPMAAAPFTPASLFGEEVDWNGVLTLLPRCMSAYVGADITCAVLASDMLQKSESALLVDIGTNGEMALWHENKLFCCSTAAGPAFEGARITMGMPGAPGAICKVYLQNGTLCYDTIDNQKPIGICGSGLIDAIAVLLETGALDETGLLCEDGRLLSQWIGEYDSQPYIYLGDSDVCITQADIRQVQLAKSAICAGMETLMASAGLSDVDTLYIAGGFGSYLDQKNARAIGLLPKATAAQTVVLGNAAGMGACMLLLNTGFSQVCRDIADRAQIVDLNAAPDFADRYMEGMLFTSE